MTAVRVLVTGAAGFVGSHVVACLHDASHEVLALDLRPAAVHNGRALRGDVRDPATVAAALDGVDAVCHQAAMVGLGVDIGDLPGYTGHNGLGTAVLLAGMARAGVRRLVLASSMVVYGAWMPRDTPYAGVASFFRSALARGQRPRVFEDGRQRRDFVDVRDVATANLAALRWTCAPGTVRAFNIGSGVPHTVGEMACALAAAFGGPEPVVTGDYRLGDVRHVTASSERARTELGWRPRIGFAEGIADFARAPLRP